MGMSKPCQRAPDWDVPFLNGETDALLYVRFGFAAFGARNSGRPGRKVCGEVLSETGLKMVFRQKVCNFAHWSRRTAQKHERLFIRLL